MTLKTNEHKNTFTAQYKEVTRIAQNFMVLDHAIEIRLLPY